MQRRKFLKAGAASLSAWTLGASAGELACDIAIIGGGTGGVAAALAACRNGLRVVLTEETGWIGGQLTAQAVPPDEHPWIEQFGCTRSYRVYRSAVRSYYRRFYPLAKQALTSAELNPGTGGVSRLTHEPKVSLAVLEQMLAPYVSAGQLTILREHLPAAAGTKGDRVTDVTVRDLRHGGRRTIMASFFLDATELGDLLPLTETEFVTGAEARSKTGELHAAQEARPTGSQAFTYCFAMDYLAGEDHTIERPAQYRFWRDYVPELAPPWTGRLLSWTACNPRTPKPRRFHFEPNPTQIDNDNLWLYRRIIDRNNFAPGTYASDITLVNWPQNDCWVGDLVTASPAERAALLERAKQLSISLLYWMQTEAPRPDGGQGWKGLRLRKDITGTEDGLAKAAYVRESRRIRAEFTILEQHVGREMRGGAAAAIFPDSVGIGAYRIDLHPSATGVNYIDVSSLPFQIPLGALLPERVDNLLPACKNIGTTHVTNGCYRLHPVEWNIGEAAGCVAVFAVKNRITPGAIRNRPLLLAEFQKSLVGQGFELAWPQEVHPV
ncbi:MAG: FAD-dependent oxidoreductase [Acidobacteriota bacterium]|nr:FAD-dependent oxidoreductase [Acidobacteriota bacterium]